MNYNHTGMWQMTSMNSCIQRSNSDLKVVKELPARLRLQTLRSTSQTYSLRSSLDPSMRTSSAETPVSYASPNEPCFRDVAVNEYIDWQWSKVHDERLEVEFQRARDITLEYGPDLKQVYEDQGQEIFIKHGVKRPFAQHFMMISQTGSRGTGIMLTQKSMNEALQSYYNVVVICKKKNRNT